MRLGETDDPLALIPGDPASIAGVAGRMYGYATVLSEAGNGLKSIDATNGWTGAAGDAFRKRFQGEPGRWLVAGACFRDAASALDRYIPTLVWAQQQAGAAIQLWSQGHKDAANSTLEDACGQLTAAANAASGAVGQARDQAPQLPGFWSKIGHFFDWLGHGAEQVGAAVAVAVLPRALARFPKGGV